LALAIVGLAAVLWVNRLQGQANFCYGLNLGGEYNLNNPHREEGVYSKESS
jgi:hypothetical protein